MGRHCAFKFHSHKSLKWHCYNPSFEDEQNKQPGLQFSLPFSILPFLSRIKEEAGRWEDGA